MHGYVSVLLLGAAWACWKKNCSVYQDPRGHAAVDILHERKALT
jgi:hypothetical protein